MKRFGRAGSEGSFDWPTVGRWRGAEMNFLPFRSRVTPRRPRRSGSGPFRSRLFRTARLRRSRRDVRPSPGRLKFHSLSDDESGRSDNFIFLLLLFGWEQMLAVAVHVHDIGRKYISVK